MRSGSSYPVAGSRHELNNHRGEEKSKWPFAVGMTTSLFKGHTCDFIPAWHSMSLKTLRFPQFVGRDLTAEPTCIEQGFLWPSHWGGWPSTSAAEGSGSPLLESPPSSSQVSCHILRSQNAPQHASWRLPRSGPAAPEFVGGQDGGGQSYRLPRPSRPSSWLCLLEEEHLETCHQEGTFQGHLHPSLPLTHTHRGLSFFLNHYPATVRTIK